MPCKQELSQAGMLRNEGRSIDQNNGKPGPIKSGEKREKDSDTSVAWQYGQEDPLEMDI